jgi:hypothetical protein
MATQPQGLVFFDLGTTFGVAALTTGGRVLSADISMASTEPWMRCARFRTEIAPLLRFCPRLGYEMFRGDFVSRDAARMLYGLEVGLLEVAGTYGIEDHQTIAPSSLQKHATGSGKSDMDKLRKKVCERWRIVTVRKNEAVALAGLNWMMQAAKVTEAFPARSGQPSIASIVAQM